MYEEYDTSKVGEDYQSNKTKMNRHNIIMWLGVLGAFLTGAVSAYRGGFTIMNILEMVGAGIIGAEHYGAGNMSPVV